MPVMVTIPFGLHGRVSDVIASNGVLVLTINGPLEKVLAAVEHAANQILRDAMVLEIEEADLLTRLTDLTCTLFRVRGEETKVHYRDNQVDIGGRGGEAVLGMSHGCDQRDEYKSVTPRQRGP